MNWKYISIIAFAGVLTACGGEDSTTENGTTEEEVGVVDTVEVDTLVETDVYTAEAAIDGPDEELWIMQPGEWTSSVEEEIPVYEVLHIIPYEEFGSEIYEAMIAINRSDFHIWGEFGKQDAHVEFYYDRDKSIKAVEFDIVNEETDGMVTVYDLKGEIYMQRRYDAGNWTESYHAPFAADWAFVQKDSWLYIEDMDNAIDPSDPAHIRIMQSVQHEQPGDNFMGSILEKESYNNPFEINDEVFTGKLTGYFNPAQLGDAYPYFELNFTNGWLDGDVKIYNDWGELELHEWFVEGELDTTIYVLDYSEMDGMAKPIIYLYPEEETDVSVKLQLNGHMTHSYPKYERGWNVTASPDGTLKSDDGKEFYALYWEGENAEEFEVKDGFVVPGEKTAEFLDESLAILGLNARERNEFIVFWLPILEDNPYNLIHFSSDQYNEMAKLNVHPEPETMIRVFMLYKPLQNPIELPIQDINVLAKKRNGFTVVEWGGGLYEGEIAL